MRTLVLITITTLAMACGPVGDADPAAVVWEGGKTDDLGESTLFSIETFGTGKVGNEVLLGLVNRHFDLRPGAIIKYFNLRRPIYRQTASYGHFGHDDLDLPWEKTDKAEILRKEALG